MIQEKLFGGVSVGVLLDVGLNSADVLLTLSDTLFTPMMVTAFTIAPEVSWLDQQLATNVAVVIAALYVIHLITKRLEVFKNVRN